VAQAHQSLAFTGLEHVVLRLIPESPSALGDGASNKPHILACIIERVTASAESHMSMSLVVLTRPIGMVTSSVQRLPLDGWPSRRDQLTTTMAITPS
jgi:hypothetical protein